MHIITLSRSGNLLTEPKLATNITIKIDLTAIKDSLAPKYFDNQIKIWFDSTPPFLRPAIDDSRSNICKKISVCMIHLGIQDFNLRPV